MSDLTKTVRGSFKLKQGKDGKFKLDFTLYDHGFNSKRLQADQAVLQAFLLALHQEQGCLNAGRVFVDTRQRVDYADFRSLMFETPQAVAKTLQSDD